ncbi:MAG: serine/threonine-protein phosphatase [Nitrosomonadales bacterium]|nr:serine/threonine-protein phosphatase [Nitrosomonadales bacterium]
MKRQNEVLQLYKSRIEEEREIARDLMQQISALDTINDPAVRFKMKPMDEFSGDLVAAARTPDGRLHLLFADGTGHGLNAALSVTPLAQLFYQMTRKGFDITSIASEMNQRVRSYLPLPRYVAAVLVSIETSMLPMQHRRTIRVWNGGCPPATLFHIDGGGIHHFRSRHLPMGVVGRDAFDSSVEYFESADQSMQLLLCSDGLTELALDSGVQLGDSGLLYLQDAPDERFDSLLILIDEALKNSSPVDDISLMLVDLTRRQEDAAPEASLADTVKSYLDDLQDQDDWSFSLILTAAQLRRLDTVPLLLNVASQFEEAHLDGKLFVVLAELFNNVLDHGLLKLDSKLKNETNGMEMYFEERASRLASLGQGKIEIRLEILQYGQNGGIRIRIHDSGSGFDHARPGFNDEHAKHGRGITLLRSLCSRLEYQGDGSEVIALLPL